MLVEKYKANVSFANEAKWYMTKKAEALVIYINLAVIVDKVVVTARVAKEAKQCNVWMKLWFLFYFVK